MLKRNTVGIISLSLIAGRKVLDSLIQNDIKCSYILINAVTYIMKEVCMPLLC